MKIMERRIRARAWRSPAAQSLRESSSSSNRPLHTTSSLHSPAASLLQDSDDDEDLIMFAASHAQEFAVRDTSTSLLETKQEASNFWNKSLLDKQQQQQHDETLKYLVFPDVMAGFDPENRPESLEALQDWLECEAHLDSTRRFQKILSSARERHDYASMGVVQRQILDWFQPLKDAFQEEQAIFMSGEKKKKSMNSYGHHLCALSPEKLAIMVSHEAILHCLVHAKVKDCGVSLASMARHIGAVVETEINVQRAIEKRMRENQAALKQDNPFLDALSDYVKGEDSLEEASSSDDLDDDDDDADLSGWMYTAHHRHLFVEEISRNRTNKRGKERIRYTNRRARAIIESTDEWTVTQHVQLGAALLEILIRVATVPGLHGQPENAFTYHKAWHNNKLVGWVLMQESLLKQIMEDSFLGQSALWTRHSPMIVPPRPWVSPSEGSYKWLKVEVMRTHGSKVQRVSNTTASIEAARYNQDLTRCHNRKHC